MIVERRPEWAEYLLKEGEERGILLGEKRGEERGRRLGVDSNKRDNALRMLGKGFSIQDVAECVDLPEDEVRHLADSLRN